MGRETSNDGERMAWQKGYALSFEREESTATMHADDGRVMLSNHEDFSGGSRRGRKYLCMVMKSSFTISYSLTHAICGF